MLCSIPGPGAASTGRLCGCSRRSIVAVCSRRQERAPPVAASFLPASERHGVAPAAGALAVALAVCVGLGVVSPAAANASPELAPQIAFSELLDWVDAGRVKTAVFEGPTHVKATLIAPTASFTEIQAPDKPSVLALLVDQLWTGGGADAPALASAMEAAPPPRSTFAATVPPGDVGAPGGLLAALRSKHVAVAFQDANPVDDDIDPAQAVARLGLFAILIYAVLGGGVDGGGAAGLLRKRARRYDNGAVSKTRFSDVAGCDEAKASLQEVADFLRSPSRYSAVGARVPKGVLLCGPPGTGKTLLAKAVAGEAGVPFFSISGSEFVELFVGLGARRARSLFADARKKAPSVIFIDELDAVGRSRSGGAGGSGVAGVANEEREQTLNQLLAEMDGFEGGGPDKAVVVLAATNRLESLDKALRRPGRFDRVVPVEAPDRRGREAILRLFLAKVKSEPGVESCLPGLAATTSGSTGADLSNLVNEAALLAVKRGAMAVSSRDLESAVERVAAGPERPSLQVSPAERRIVAVHECGHAITGALAPSGGAVTKVSIVPRMSAALGFTLRAPLEDRFLAGEDECRGALVTFMGGRAAERLVFDRLTTGAADDIRRATAAAEAMVRSYGFDSGIGGVGPRAVIAPETALVESRSDGEGYAAVGALLKEADAWAGDILARNKALLVEMADELLREETLDGEALKAFLTRAIQPDGLEAWLMTGKASASSSELARAVR